MTRISIFHNLSRDAGFGLNCVFFHKDPGGYVKETQAGAHELVKVFEFGLDDLMFADESRYLGCTEIANRVDRVFNVGDDPTFTKVGSREHTLALAYRARKLRSLSKGDVLAFHTDAGPVLYFACNSLWEQVGAGELNIVDAAEAIRLVRERFGFGAAEPLAITVPLES
jgi:hypothetical protein